MFETFKTLIILKTYKTLNFNTLNYTVNESKTLKTLKPSDPHNP